MERKFLSSAFTARICLIVLPLGRSSSLSLSDVDEILPECGHHCFGGSNVVGSMRISVRAARKLAFNLSARRECLGDHGRYF